MAVWTGVITADEAVRCVSLGQRQGIAGVCLIVKYYHPRGSIGQQPPAGPLINDLEIIWDIGQAIFRRDRGRDPPGDATRLEGDRLLYDYLARNIEGIARVYKGFDVDPKKSLSADRPTTEPQELLTYS